MIIYTSTNNELSIETSRQLQATLVSSDLKLRTLLPAPENMVKYNTSRFQVSSTRSVGGVLPYMGGLPIYGKTSHVCGTSPLWEHFPHMGRLPNYKKPSHTWEVFHEDDEDEDDEDDQDDEDDDDHQVHEGDEDEDSSTYDILYRRPYKPLHDTRIHDTCMPDGGRASSQFAQHTWCKLVKRF